MPKTTTYEEVLIKLQETGLMVNEAKQNGQTTVPIENYEMLLNWFIECMNQMNEQYEKLYDQMRTKDLAMNELFKEAERHKLT